MPVTSTTIGGVNCWLFSGAVTQAEITTAWAALLVTGEYTPARALYFDNTCDMTAVQGGFSVNMTTGTQSIILHTGRNKTNTILKYWNIRYTAGLSVGNRTLRCVGWNGTSFVTFSGSSSETDGLGMYGGSHTYAVAGNPGGGDPRYLDEFAFGLIGGGLQISSASFTEQELQPDIRGQKDLNDVTFTRCFGFPQVTGPSTRISMWRCYENTMHPSQKPVRLYDRASVFYIDSTLRRNNAAITSNLIDAYGSSTGFNVAFAALNNWQDETWFGVSKTSLSTANWATGNVGYGGVLKKLQFVGVGAAGTVKCYDSRSTTVPQRGTFVGNTTFDGLAAGTSTATDASGKVWIALVGADLNASSQITRYTGQKYTFQAFGYRVSVSDVDMTAGGDDNTAPYTPVVPATQPALARTQAAINAATTIDTFQQLLEELHVLAIGLSGAASYAGAYGGNLFDLVNGALQTSFSSVTVDATAASKISYNSTTNALTIKSSTLASTATVSQWTNTGTISTANGATITGTYTDSTGTRAAIKSRIGKTISLYITVNSTAIGGTVVNGTLVPGWYPMVTSTTITVQPTDQVRIVANYWGGKPAVFNMLGSEIDKFMLDFEVEPAVDTTISTVSRDAVAGSLASLANGSNIEVTVNKTLVAYSAAEVISGFAYYIFSKGYLIFSAISQANNANIYALANETVIGYAPNYKLRMADLDSTGAQIQPSTTGYIFPLVVYYTPDGGLTKSPITVLNAYGAKIETSLKAGTQATLSDYDKAAIAAKVDASTVLAKEATVATRASQTSVNSIPTNPVLATDTRLNNLDATVSSRSTLTAQQIPAGLTADQVWAATTRTLTSSSAPTAAQNAAAVRAELATELSRVDATVSSRLAASSYTAPDNTSIAAIKAKTDTITPAPSAADIKTAMEAAGSKLDKAMKAAQSAEDQTA